MRDIDEIIIHCSATKRQWMEGMTGWAKRMEIKRWHLKRGWRDIGYHALIDRDGTIISGRDTDYDGDVWEEIGAHVAGRNATSLGVCLIGGWGSNEADDFTDHFTLMQERALVEWIKDRQQSFPSIKVISGHNQYAAKACPGFDVPEWWDRHRPRATAPDVNLKQTLEPDTPSGLECKHTIAEFLDWLKGRTT